MSRARIPVVLAAAGCATALGVATAAAASATVTAHLVVPGQNGHTSTNCVDDRCAEITVKGTQTIVVDLTATVSQAVNGAPKLTRSACSGGALGGVFTVTIPKLTPASIQLSVKINGSTKVIADAYAATSTPTTHTVSSCTT